MGVNFRNSDCDYLADGTWKRRGFSNPMALDGQAIIHALQLAIKMKPNNVRVYS